MPKKDTKTKKKAKAKTKAKKVQEPKKVKPENTGVIEEGCKGTEGLECPGAAGTNDADVITDEAKEAAEKLEAEEQAKLKADEEAEAEKKAKKPVTIPTLHFKSSGWCEALGKSYFRGIHKCSSVEEYEALKEFAETK